MMFQVWVCQLPLSQLPLPGSVAVLSEKRLKELGGLIRSNSWKKSNSGQKEGRRSQDTTVGSWALSYFWVALGMSVPS